jgi:heavy metal sensor kinase
VPLRIRLALLFALATAVVVTLGGVALMLQLRLSVEASLDPGLRARVAIVTDELGSEDLTTDPNVGGDIFQVARPDGTVLRASSQAGPDLLLDVGQQAQAMQGELSFTGTVAGARTRLLATMATTDQGRLLVVVGTGTVVSDVAVERVETALLFGGPPAVVLAGLGAWLLAGAVLRPVERMRRQAASITESDLGRRLAIPPTRDEIAALGRTINGLLARLQAAIERERSFVADASHELRTPLAILRTELELARRPGRSRDDLVEAVEAAGVETDRLVRLAEDLLLLARADNEQLIVRPGPVDIPELLADAVRGIALRTPDRAVTVSLTCSDSSVIRADADRLRQALDNLLDNAARYAPPGTTVEVRSHTENGVVTVEVCDRGPGFPIDFLPHAFGRFERAESARSRDDGGTGLGLSIVDAIVSAHGGRATAANRDGGGARLTLELPADGPEVGAGQRRQRPTAWSVTRHQR